MMKWNDLHSLHRHVPFLIFQLQAYPSVFLQSSQDRDFMRDSALPAASARLCHCRCWRRMRALLLPLSFLFVFCPWEHRSSFVSLQNLVVAVVSRNSHRIHREVFPTFAEPAFSHPTAYNTSCSYRGPSDQRSGVPTPQGPASAQRCQPQLNSTPPQRSEFFSSGQTLLLSFNKYSLFSLFSQP